MKMSKVNNHQSSYHFTYNDASICSQFSSISTNNIQIIALLTILLRNIDNTATIIIPYVKQMKYLGLSINDKTKLWRLKIDDCFIRKEYSNNLTQWRKVWN